MAGVSATLEFDAQAAFDAVDQIEAAFTGIAQDFGVQLAQAIEGVAGTPIEPEVDTASITAEVDEALAAVDGLVPVEADTAGVAGEVQDAVDTADTTVVIDGDTTGLQDSVDQAKDSVDELSNSSNTAASGLGSLSGASAGVGAAAGLATGDVSGLSSAVGGLSVGAGAAVGAIAAVGGAAVTFFGQAVEAAGAQERFNQVLGSSADAVANVDVGGLNTDLGELAISAGTSDEAMLGATTRIFGIGQAMGEARPQLESTTETLAAVATNASLLNPALGDAAGATTNLFNAASTGRQRALVQFGINLTKAQIDALAVEQGLARTTDEVTAFDRATVVANQALSQTPDLLQSITDGTQNTEVRLAALKERFGEVLEAAGQPLIAPGFDLLGEALPIVEALASGLGTLAAGALPAVSAGLDLLGPPLRLISALLEVIPSQAIAAAVAFYAVQRALGAITFALYGATGAASALNPIILAIAAAAAVAVVIFGDFGSSQDDAAESSRALAQAGQDLISSYADTGSIVAAVAEQVRSAVTDNEALSDALSLTGTSAEEFARRLVEAEAAGGSFSTLATEMGSQVASAGGSFEDTVQAVRVFAEGMQDAARRAIETAVATGAISREQADAAITASEAAGGTADYVGALGNLPAVAALSADGISQLNDAVMDNIPTLQEAITNVDNAGEAFGALNASTNPQLVIDNLVAMIDAFGNFSANIATIRETSSLVAETLATLGPDIAGPFTAALAQAPPTMTQQLDFVLQVARAKGVELSDVLTGFTANGIQGATDALAGSAGEFGVAGTTAGTAGAGGVEGGLAGVESAAAGAGAAAANSFADALGLVNALAGAAMILAGVAILVNAPIAMAQRAGDLTGAVFGAALSTSASAGTRGAMALVTGAIVGAAPYGLASSTGLLVGQLIGGGIASGIRSMVSSISAAAADAVNEAEAAARAAADSHSPSRVFMAVGADMGRGLNIGFDDEASRLQRSAALQVAGAVDGARSAIGSAGRLVLAATSAASLAAGGSGSSGTDALFGPGSIVVQVTGPVSDGQVRAVTAATRTGVEAALARKRLRSTLTAKG